MRTDILIYKTARDIQKKYSYCFKELGLPDLTFTQYIVLRELWDSEEGILSEKELGKLLSLDSGTLTPVLKGLEKNGLVARSRSKNDERVVNVSLTDQGRAMRFSTPFATEGEDRETERILSALLEAKRK